MPEHRKILDMYVACFTSASLTQVSSCQEAQSYMEEKNQLERVFAACAFPLSFRYTSNTFLLLVLFGNFLRQI